MSKSETRAKILRTMRTQGIQGMTASEIAERAKIHPATARRHLAAMREEKLSGVAGTLSERLDFRMTPGGFRYSLCEPNKAIRTPRPSKRRTTRRKARTKPQGVPAKKVARKVATLAERVLAELARGPKGVHELGAALRVRRGNLQAELDRLGLQRERQRGRWVYQAA